MVLMVMGITTNLLANTCAIGYGIPVVWYGIAVLLVLRYTTCRYRITDVAGILLGATTPTVWVTAISYGALDATHLAMHLKHYGMYHLMRYHLRLHGILS